MLTKEQLEERKILDQPYITIVNELIGKLIQSFTSEDIDKYKTVLFIVKQIYTYQLSNDSYSIRRLWSVLETVPRYHDVLTLIKSTYPEKRAEFCGWLS